MKDWGSSCHMILIVIFSSLILFSGLRDMNWIAGFFSVVLISFMCAISEEKKCRDCERNCKKCEYKAEYIENHPEEFEEYGG